MLSSSVVFALEIPIITGMGFTMDYNMTSYKGRVAYNTSLESQVNYSIFSGGALAFFDFHYAEFSLGFSGLANKVTGSERLRENNGGQDPTDASLSGATVSISLYGKYPFDFGNYAVYPILGFEGRFCISMRYTEDSVWDDKKEGDSYQGNASDWSAFWLRLGAGLDFFLGDALFVRGELTFGIKFNTPRERAIVNRLVQSGTWAEVVSFGAGGKLALTIGYKFGTFNLGGGGGGGGGRAPRGGGSSGGTFGGSGGGGSGGGDSSRNDIYRPIQR
jgi:hypothetical protein